MPIFVSSASFFSNNPHKKLPGSAPSGLGTWTLFLGGESSSHRAWSILRVRRLEAVMTVLPSRLFLSASGYNFHAGARGKHLSVVMMLNYSYVKNSIHRQ